MPCVLPRKLKLKGESAVSFAASAAALLEFIVSTGHPSVLTPVAELRQRYAIVTRLSLRWK